MTLFALDIPECQKGLGQVRVLGLLKRVVELRGSRGKRVAWGDLALSSSRCSAHGCSRITTSHLPKASSWTTAPLSSVCFPKKGLCRDAGRSGRGGGRRQVR